MKPLDEVRAELAEELDGIFPFELSTLLNFLDKQRRGKLGRAREIYRNQVGPAPGADPTTEGRMSRLRVGVVGAGALGRHHARIYSQLPSTELMAVADTFAERGRAVADACGTHWFADYRQLFDLVDAVSIAVPTAGHHAVALEFLERGIAVPGREAVGCDRGASGRNCRRRRSRRERPCKSDTSSDSTPPSKRRDGWSAIRNTSTASGSARTRFDRRTSASCST